MAIAEVTVPDVLPSDHEPKKHPWRWHGSTPTAHIVKYVTGEVRPGSEHGYEILTGDTRESCFGWFACFLDALYAMRKHLNLRNIPYGSMVIRSRDGAVLADGKHW